MKKKSLRFLTVKLLVIVAPVALFYAAVSFLLYRGDEITAVDRVVEVQSRSSRPCLFGPAYSNPDVYYKKTSVLKRSPKVLALGSSRVMQFRSTLFKEDGAFYNAGGGAAMVQHFVPFLQQIDRHRPQVLIVGLDHYFFNDNWMKQNRYDAKAYAASLNHSGDAADLVETAKFALVKDILKKKVPVRELLASGAQGRFGLTALFKGDGFANDGSYRYGHRVLLPQEEPDFRFQDTLRRLKTGGNRFEYASEVAPAALAELDRLLSYCRSRSIHVVAFLPPYAPSVVRELAASGRHGYLRQLPSQLASLVARHGQSFFDFTDMTPFGSGDGEFVDGFHGSEITYAKILLHMAQHDPLLEKYADVQRIRRLLRTPFNNLWLESNPV